MEVLIEKNHPVCTIIINRPEMKNAVNGKTAHLLFDAFNEFESDETLSAAVLYGEGGTLFTTKATSSSINDPTPAGITVRVSMSEILSASFIFSGLSTLIAVHLTVVLISLKPIIAGYKN